MAGSYWAPTTRPGAFQAQDLIEVCSHFREPAAILADPATGRNGIGLAGRILDQAENGSFPVLGNLPALYPENLGDRSFLDAHGVCLPYIAGEMAHGIAGTDLVIAMGRARMLAFYGSGGVPLDRMEKDLRHIAAQLPSLSWGSNILHSPSDPELEDRTVDLYLRLGVRRACASAYLRLTPAIVRYAVSGLHTDPAGRIVRTNRLFAKLSRPELAQMFLSPAPEEITSALVGRGLVTAQEVALAKNIPLSEDITVEADSGGHTDNRPMVALLPAILTLRDRMVAERGYADPVRIGAAGGIGAPASAAAAFSMGAAYVLTGSINQASVEAATSPVAKQMLAEAGMADVSMAPSPDMFEMGVRVQVLKRATLFPGRAGRLYELYSQYNAIEEIPTAVREKLERDLFRRPLDQVWQETERFFASRNPVELQRAAKDSRYKMALVFRWYVGQSSHWAIAGTADRRADYQIWCGPAMGAFNAWAKGSFLEDVSRRNVVQIALNLMEGAAAITRALQFRMYGVPVPAAALDYKPRPLQVSQAAV